MKTTYYMLNKTIIVQPCVCVCVRPHVQVHGCVYVNAGMHVTYAYTTNSNYV